VNRRDFLTASAGLLFVRPLSWHAVDPKLKELDQLVRGPVLLPSNPAYAQARLTYNARFDKHPLAVVRPRDAQDVRAVVRWARKYDVVVIPRSGGHSYGGYSSGSGVVVDLSRFTGVHVTGSTAVIAAGTKLINVYSALSGHDANIPAGSCPTVAIGGHALGGGIGFASRKLGTVSDNVVSMVAVTGTGQLVQVSAHSHPNLYWALRGGGGRNFGIVTSFRVRLTHVTSASWFRLTLPWSSAPDTVRMWQQWAPGADPRLFSICSLGNKTLQVFGQFMGGESQLKAALPPWLAGATTGTAAYFDLMRRWAGCLSKSLPECRTLHRTTFAAKSDYVNTPMPKHAVEIMQSWLEQGRGSLLIDSYGGAIRHGGGAFAHRGAICSLQYLTYWSGNGAANLAWLRGFHAAMRPHVSGGAYINYIDPDLRTNYRKAYYGTHASRLVSVRKKYDPDRVFRFAQAV